MSDFDTLLRSCGGLRVESEQKNPTYGKPYIQYTFFKEGDLVIPENVYIEITGTATKGTIARVVDIEVETYGERYPGSSHSPPDKLMTYDNTIIYEVDGRKQKGRIKSDWIKVLAGEHQTKYVRNVKKHEKKEVKNPVNKYKQELQRGDWVVGVKPGKKLGIGRITRWTNHNVWGTLSSDLNDKSKEFKFDSIAETFTMPNDDHVQLLTMAVLKGYRG